MWIRQAYCAYCSTETLISKTIPKKYAGRYVNVNDFPIPIKCFHPRGQYLCKFIGTKESVCIRKEFNSRRIGLEHQHGRRFIVFIVFTNMATVTSCENTLYLLNFNQFICRKAVTRHLISIEEGTELVCRKTHLYILIKGRHTEGRGRLQRGLKC